MQSCKHINKPNSHLDFWQYIGRNPIIGKVCSQLSQITIFWGKLFFITTKDRISSNCSLCQVYYNNYAM